MCVGPCANRNGRPAELDLMDGSALATAGDQLPFLTNFVPLLAAGERGIRSLSIRVLLPNAPWIQYPAAPVDAHGERPCMACTQRYSWTAVVSQVPERPSAATCTQSSRTLCAAHLLATRPRVRLMAVVGLAMAWRANRLLRRRRPACLLLMCRGWRVEERPQQMCRRRCQAKPPPRLPPATPHLRGLTMQEKWQSRPLQGVPKRTSLGLAQRFLLLRDGRCLCKASLSRCTLRCTTWLTPCAMRTPFCMSWSAIRVIRGCRAWTWDVPRVWPRK